ncbi:hypothetical protein ACXR2T_06250 [Leucobacter sp. HY1910]
MMVDEFDGEPVPPPEYLGVRGAAFWVAQQAAYEWDEHDSQVLVEACRTLDTIDALAAAIEHDGVMLAGSQGQPVLNGAVAELRQQQTSLARLLAALDLDAEEVGVKSPQQVRSQTANRARWKGGRRG